MTPSAPPPAPRFPSASAPGPDGPSRLSAGSPEDLLAYIPHHLGFAPRNSLVALTTLGHSVRALVRADLPPDSAAGASWLNDYAATFVSNVLYDADADGVLLAFYADQPWRDLHRPPYARLLAALEHQLAEATLTLGEAWYVGPRYWRTLRCPDPACCPWPGGPVAGIADSVVNTELVFLGSSYDEDVQAAAAALVEPSADHVRAGFEAETDAELLRLGPGICGASQFRAVLEAWEWALLLEGRQPGGHLPPGLLPFLAASLRSRMVRDAVLVQSSVGAGMAWTGTLTEGLLSPAAQRPDAPHSRLAWPNGTIARPSCWPAEGAVPEAVRTGFIPAPGADPGDFGRILTGRGDSRPDWRRVQAATAVLRLLARAGQDTPRVAAVTMLAWLEWTKGKGMRASALLGLALAEDPDYRLAVLLMELLGRGVLCGWAQDRTLAWRQPG